MSTYWQIRVEYLNQSKSLLQFNKQHAPPNPGGILSPYQFTTSKWIIWLYILGVQLNFYQNITEIFILLLYICCGKMYLHKQRIFLYNLNSLKNLL